MKKRIQTAMQVRKADAFVVRMLMGKGIDARLRIVGRVDMVR
jgi:hypothetical protein